MLAADVITVPVVIILLVCSIVLTGFVAFATWLVKRHIELATIQASMMQQLVMLKESEAEHHERLTYLERRTPTVAVRA